MAGIDVAMKHPISDFPQDWSEWLGVPRGTPVRVVDSDVSTVATIADRVIEVLGPRPFVLHIEPQSYYDKYLDVRMYESNGRLTKRQQQFVHTTVLLLTKKGLGPSQQRVLSRAITDERLPSRFSLQRRQSLGVTGQANLVIGCRHLATGSTE